MRLLKRVLACPWLRSNVLQFRWMRGVRWWAVRHASQPLLQRYADLLGESPLRGPVPSFSTSGHLSRQIFNRLFLVGAVIVTMATVVSYYLAYHQSKRTTLAALQQYTRERQMRENHLFLLARQILLQFREQLLGVYLSDISYTKEDFWELFFVDEDGATRMRPSEYQAHVDPDMGMVQGISGFVGKDQSVESADLQRRLIVATLLVSRYAPAWTNVGNLHVTFPENAIVVYCADSPWGLDARADLPMNQLGVVKATLQHTNPRREPVWTGLYFDATAGSWTITYEMPVDHGGKHLFNPSLDIRLEEIMDRMISQHPDESYNFLITHDGFLVAHPDESLKKDKQWKGILSLDEVDNPDITRMYQLIQKAQQEQRSDLHVIDDTFGEHYLLAARLTGPDWWLVTVYPKAQLSRQAHKASRIVLVLGASIFLFSYMINFVIIHNRVQKPLRMLQRAISRISRGEFDEVAQHPESLPVEQNNEIGRLAGSFLDMSIRIRDINLHLENTVDRRTRALERANAQLRELSLLDGLTGIHNRRSFDRDLANVFRQASAGVESFAIMMMDVDDFKLFNDTYGHTAGDRVLKAIAQAVQCSIREEDRVYRYGGEEFVAILNSIQSDFASTIGERILEAVRELREDHQASVHGHVTLSAGLVVFDPGFASPTQMVAVADEKLYQAKAAGKNCLRA